MRPPTKRRLSALLAAAVLAALMSAAAGPGLPKAAAHGETATTPECSHPVWKPGLRDARLPQPGALPLHDHILLPARRVRLIGWRDNAT